MIERADAYVRNKSTLISSIDVVSMRGTEKKQEATVSNGNVVKIPLPDLETSLVISAPGEVDTKRLRIKVQADVDLTMTHSRFHRNWTLKIIPNELRPSIPLDVNVTIEDDGP